MDWVAHGVHFGKVIELASQHLLCPTPSVALARVYGLMAKHAFGSAPPLRTPQSVHLPDQCDRLEANLQPYCPVMKLKLELQKILLLE